ncbi:MAG: hypothetical protein ACYCY3_05675 [Halothiobacillus sp.]
MFLKYTIFQKKFRRSIPMDFDGAHWDFFDAGEEFLDGVFLAGMLLMRQLFLIDAVCGCSICWYLLQPAQNLCPELCSFSFSIDLVVGIEDVEFSKYWSG